jgi:transcription elongation factor Elf1
MNDLKPCPFCYPGTVVRMVATIHEPSDQVVCENCGEIVDLETWNFRPIEDSLRAEIATLKARLAVFEEGMPHKNDIEQSVYEIWEEYLAGSHAEDVPHVFVVRDWLMKIAASRGEG